MSKSTITIELNDSFRLTINRAISFSLSSSKTVVKECAGTSPTSYFWFRKALDITDSIEASGTINPIMTGCLLAAWTIVCLAMIKGIKSSAKVTNHTFLIHISMGLFRKQHLKHETSEINQVFLLLFQVMYFSSVFPYVVLFIFLIRGLMLDGAMDGVTFMFYPKVSTLVCNTFNTLSRFAGPPLCINVLLFTIHNISREASCKG